MSMLRKMKTFLSKDQETSENHYDEALKSHYYKITAKKAIEAVENVFSRQPGVSITSVSEERGEICIVFEKPKKALMTVTIVSVRPYETAIDFNVSTDTKLASDFGFSRKLIIEAYEKLNKALPFIGTGLHSK
ncbi:cytosolic protein [Metabacillus idriensis]|uniref:cytosolic protein n=1 Tax=Metabacillus idriensis TaxID=324768 RepID=UPI00174E3F0A|nr:cytosolic protein [Metabacillus idriensis]